MNYINSKNFSARRFAVQTAIAFSMVILTIGCALAQKTQTGNQANALVGRWVSDEATVEIRADGTLSINGDEFAYKVKNSVITVYGDDGTMRFPFEISGDTMTVQFEDREIVYTRAKGKNNSGGASQTRGANPPELVGKWCYLSNVNGGGGARTSSRCFVLNANGTYEYQGETSSNGDNGATSSQSYDTGRWSATATTITAYSKTNGTITYSLQKRNHPKSGDPMLIVDGDAYVTFYQKPSW